jgi:hypothetical protein
MLPPYKLRLSRGSDCGEIFGLSGYCPFLLNLTGKLYHIWKFFVKRSHEQNSGFLSNSELNHGFCLLAF